MLFEQLKKLLGELAEIHAPDSHAHISFCNIVDIRIQDGVINFPLRLPKQQHCVLEGIDIVLQKRCNGIFQHMPVIGGKMAHHS